MTLKLKISVVSLYFNHQSFLYTMSRYTTLLFLLFITVSLQSQTLGLCAEVIASTGQSVEKQGITYSYTVGEPVIFALTNLNLTLTQGFHQPDLCGLVGTNTPEALANWQVEIYPNPTSDLLFLKINTQKNPKFRLDIFDVLGKLVRTDFNIQANDIQSIKVIDLVEGNYFLRLTDLDTKTYTISRFVKID
jgi:hypothetical protein